MKIIIIEDEHAGAEILVSTLMETDDSIEILGVCEDEEQTLDLIKIQHDVDAIFSDIQLMDTLSFKVLKKIDPNIPVVFVTAYNEYALEAFQHHGIDYVLKPFSRSDIEKAVQKLKTYKTGQSASDKVKMEQLFQYLEKRPRFKNSFLVGFQDRLIPLNAQDIVCFVKLETDIFVCSSTKKSYRISESLDSIEKQLDPKSFFRANRQFIIHRSHIEDIRHYFNGRLKVKMNIEIDQDIIISKAKASEFKNWLDH